MTEKTEKQKRIAGEFYKAGGRDAFLDEVAEAYKRREKMGKIKDAIQDWLEDTGYDLGYDWDNYPDIKDWGDIKLNKITARTYYENIRSNGNSRKRK